MKITNILFILAVALALTGCGAKVQENASSPSAEADSIDQEIISEDLDTSDLDSLDSDLSEIDAALEEF